MLHPKQRERSDFRPNQSKTKKYAIGAGIAGGALYGLHRLLRDDPDVVKPTDLEIARARTHARLEREGKLPSEYVNPSQRDITIRRTRARLQREGKL